LSRLFETRIGHWLILLTVSGTLNLINLGGPSLWDIDEGKNAEAAREMLESENYILPTFNYEPRYEKPALIYWLQAVAYHTFGVNEFSARLPSALAGILTVLLIYELGRSLFNHSTGLIAGIVLASSTGVCVAARFANPDALLNACTVLTMFAFWRGCTTPNKFWFFLWGAAAGLGFLAKGPVAFVLPAGCALVFLAWSKSLGRLWDSRVLLAVLAFIVVGFPWYVWVAIESRGQFLRGFFLKENVGRFMQPMENHGGPLFYYVAVLLLGSAPWSIFLGIAGWFGLGKRAGADTQVASNSKQFDPYRFLWCWLLPYLVFFSSSGTKLPNYILPLYAPVAFLIARYLDRWRLGCIQPASWTTGVAVAALMAMGVGTTAALFIAGGTIQVSALHGRYLAGLGRWAYLGIVPFTAALVFAWCLRQGKNRWAISTLAICACLFNGLLLGFAGESLDKHKAPRILIAESGTCDELHDIRIGSYQAFEPSMVFYCHREVESLTSEQKALEFIQSPSKSFLFLPEASWQTLAAKAGAACQVLARHEDMYRHCTVVVVSNQTQE
jgi:4-amino-4-deoxy-L-arabinose transferase-like glycosyltransferase